MILNGWKEIARYLGRGVRTVQRWEEFGLPIRRPNGSRRSEVVAASEELDAWVQHCKTHGAERNRTSELTQARENTARLLAELRQRQALLQTQIGEIRGQIKAQRERLNAIVGRAGARPGARYRSGMEDGRERERAPAR